MDQNFDHQMFLSKSKCWYSNNFLHFLSALFHFMVLANKSTTSRVENFALILYCWIKFANVPHRHHIKINILNTNTACLVCLVSTVSGCCKNAHGRGSASSSHKTKLEQSTFLRYLWCSHIQGLCFRLCAWVNCKTLLIIPQMSTVVHLGTYGQHYVTSAQCY